MAEETIKLDPAGVHVGAGIDEDTEEVKMLRVDADKKLKVNSQGNIAADSADSGNPVKVGGKYNATPPTLDDGDRGDLELDVNSNAKVTQGTQADEDNDKIAIIGKASKHYAAAAAVNEVVKASAGTLIGIVIGKTVANSIIEISDHASDGDGNVQIYLDAPVQGTYMFGNGVDFSVGICADITLAEHTTFIYE